MHTLSLANAKEVKEILRVPLPQVYSLVNQLPPGIVVRIGRRVRFNRDALMSWIATGGHTAQPEAAAG